MQRHKQASVCCRYRRHGDQPGPVYRCVPVSSERPWFTPVDSAETTCRPWIKIPSNINIPRSNPLRNRGTFQGENPQCKPWVGSRPGARLDGGGVVTATMDAQRQQRRSSTLRVLDAIGAQTLLHSRLQMSGDHERTAAYIRHGLVRPLLSASPPGPPLLPLDRGLPSVLRVWSSGVGERLSASGLWSTPGLQSLHNTPVSSSLLLISGIRQEDDTIQMGIQSILTPPPTTLQTQPHTLPTDKPLTHFQHTLLSHKLSSHTHTLTHTAHSPHTPLLTLPSHTLLSHTPETTRQSRRAGTHGGGTV